MEANLWQYLCPLQRGNMKTSILASWPKKRRRRGRRHLSLSSPPLSSLRGRLGPSRNINFPWLRERKWKPIRNFFPPFSSFSQNPYCFSSLLLPLCKAGFFCFPLPLSPSFFLSFFFLLPPLPRNSIIQPAKPGHPAAKQARLSQPTSQATGNNSDSCSVKCILQLPS